MKLSKRENDILIAIHKAALSGYLANWTPRTREKLEKLGLVECRADGRYYVTKAGKDLLSQSIL